MFRAAASGAPFHVIERETGKCFLSQLRPLDDSLTQNIEIHNNIEHPNIAQFKHVVADQGIAVVVYQNAKQTLLDSLNDSFGRKYCEEQARRHVRQLLLALKCLHDNKIVHLDLRPEVLMLRDNQLLLSDFSQCRRLQKGKVSATAINGNPEFVSPEIAAGIPVTLASDMWSVGTLTYLLLSGTSPFLGINDQETVKNLLLGSYSLDIKEFGDISDAAKDFIAQLLVTNVRNRLTVDEALLHPWITASSATQKLVPVVVNDSLKKFKYRSKWLVITYFWHG